MKNTDMTDAYNNHFKVVDDIDDIHKLLFLLLKQFHDICEANHLIYNLANGTMLGAVRHQSFIPWDDDVDVSMPRQDYEKFLKVVRENYADYCVLSYGAQDYPYPYAKFGFRDTILIEHSLKEQYARSFLFMDIFPKDGFPDKRGDQRTHIRHLRQLKKNRIRCIINPQISSIPWKRHVSYIRNGYSCLLSRLWGMEYFLRKEIETAGRYSYQDSSLVFNAFHYTTKSIMKKKDYLNRKRYSFGDFFFWGVCDYDRYLSKLYGNYKKYPPVEEQVPKHDYTLYVSEELYKKISRK